MAGEEFARTSAHGDIEHDIDEGVGQRGDRDEGKQCPNTREETSVE